MSSVHVVVPALLVAFLWGIHPVITKFLLSSQDISFQTLIVLSSAAYFMCTIGLAVYYRDVMKKDVSKMTWRNIFWISVISILCGFLANLIYFKVLKTHQSYVVSALIYAAPMFSLLCAWLFLREKISKYGLLGVMLIIVGTFFIAYNEIFPSVDPFETD